MVATHAAAPSAALFWVDGTWHDRPPMLLSPADHAFWQSSVVFDGARGPSWWKAPLIASLAVTLTYSAVFYPLAFAGAYDGWTESAWVHDVVFFAVSTLLLVPYALLRPAMRPLEGLNGY